MKISLIAAIGEQNQLGKDNQLLWHISEDLKNFKKLTLDKCIVMGRKTFDSIGRPLPKRTNIILTRDRNFKCDQAVIFHEKEKLLDWAHENCSELVIIGGSEIYQLFLPYVDTLYLSRVDYNGPADVYFPKIEFSKWKLIEERINPEIEDWPAWTFQVYEKQSN